MVDNRLIGHKFGGNLGSLPSFCKAIIFTSSQGSGKYESQIQWLMSFVRCTSCLLGMSSIPEAFLSFSDCINLMKSCGLISSGCSLSTASSRAWTPPPTVYGCHHTSHVVWTAFPSNQQLHWLSLMDEILDLKDNEWQLVPLVHPCSWGTSQWAVLLKVWLQC
jgi:hypothetical protein